MQLVFCQLDTVAEVLLLLSHLRSQLHCPQAAHSHYLCMMV